MTDPREELPALAEAVALRVAASTAGLHTASAHTRDDIDSLSQAADELHTRVDAAAAEHTAECRATRDRIATARVSLSSALEQFESRTAQLSQSARQVRERIDHATAANVDAQDKLRDEVQKAAQRLDSKATGVAQNAGAMVSDIDALLSQLGAGSARLVERLSHLDHFTNDRVSILSGELDSLVGHVRATADAVTTTLRREQESFRDVLQGTMADTFLGHLESASERLRSSLDALNQSSATHSADVGDRSSSVVGKIREVLQVFETIRPVLEMIRTMLGN